MKPSIGRIVHYTLSKYDVDVIQNRRKEDGTYGNAVREGDVYPAVVVRTFHGESINAQVLLDGPDSFWACSRNEGDQPGTWAWPPRV